MCYAGCLPFDLFCFVLFVLFCLFVGVFVFSAGVGVQDSTVMSSRVSACVCMRVLARVVCAWYTLSFCAGFSVRFHTYTQRRALRELQDRYVDRQEEQMQAIMRAGHAADNSAGVYALVDNNLDQRQLAHLNRYAEHRRRGSDPFAQVGRTPTPQQKARRRSLIAALGSPVRVCCVLCAHVVGGWWLVGGCVGACGCVCRSSGWRVCSVFLFCSCCSLAVLEHNAAH